MNRLAAWRARRQDLARRRAETARRWAATPHQPPSDDPVVVFLIPLISRARARDWDLVVALLQGTLSSLIGQRDVNWHALICGQNQPEGLPDDPRLSFLPYETPDADLDSTTRFDKWDKRRQLVARLATQFAGRDGYVFPLDADDLIHPALVAHVRADNNGGGYYAPTGYMMDHQTGALAWCGPRSIAHPFAKPFLRHCGSSAAIRFDFRQSSAGAELYLNMGKHKELPQTMAAHGLTLEPLPFPGGIYVINHGDNIRSRRGKMDEKLTYLRRNRLKSAEADAARATFGLPAPRA